MPVRFIRHHCPSPPTAAETRSRSLARSIWLSHGDLPVILAFVMLAAAFVVIANIIVDLFYAVLDPRVRIS